MPRILLVEDDEPSRDMLSRRLARRAFEVITAVNGEEAVALASAIQPDLVLMDVSLPHADGLEATRRIKSNAALAAIPVIALSAHAMTRHREECLKAGCDDYDTKPIDFARLLGKIDGLLGRQDASGPPPRRPTA